MSLNPKQAIILGCGNSSGVPAVGNYWGACDPSEPKNRRGRCSLAVMSENTIIVVDTGPDFRDQVNREDLGHIDAVLYTHSHGDHMNGIDDLRVLSFKQKMKMPVYGDQATIDDAQGRFFYLFGGGNHSSYPPVLEGHVIEPDTYGQTMTIGDIIFTPFEQDHGSCKSLGYRFGSLGYSVDMFQLDDAGLKTLKGVDTWIVDGTGFKSTENKVHANLETIYRYNDIIGAKQVYISSLSLSMDYQSLCDELPEGFAPAHDGLKVDIIE